jgi:hypothetical protein|tara:strand:- start:4032 stop:4151 length:120 start_codon:yes stop_codon:yes gene_type:complete
MLSTERRDFFGHCRNSEAMKTSADFGGQLSDAPFRLEST